MQTNTLVSANYCSVFMQFVAIPGRIAPSGLGHIREKQKTLDCRSVPRNGASVILQVVAEDGVDRGIFFDRALSRSF